MAGVINRTADFFGKKYTSDQVEGLIDHLSIDKMRLNKAVNMKSIMDAIENSSKQNTAEERKQFMRKGIVGDHKNLMSEEDIKQFDDWIAEMKNNFELSDDKDFPY